MRGILLSLALLAASPLMAGQRVLLFYQNDDEREALELHLKPVLKAPDAPPCEYLHVVEKGESVDQAAIQSQAMMYGVRLTPTLVWLDEQGCYTRVEGSDLSAKRVAELQKRTGQGCLPDERLRLLAELYLQRAQVASPLCTERQLAEAVAFCRVALHQKALSVEDKQLVGVRMLYPLLLRQYTRWYKERGAHYPNTEAKLLEAVAAIEAARDLDPESSLGRQAFALRDELRRARIKARAYE